MKTLKTVEEKANSEEWGAWKFVSDMLDHPNEYGIYPTSKCYEQIHDFVVEQKQKALTTHTQDIIEMIEGMKLEYFDEKYSYYTVFTINAVNTFLNQIQTKLKESINPNK